eukprot:c33287_g1_i1 orf=74-1144(+)
MAELESGEGVLKRARPDQSEQAVRDANSPEQVHAAKKLCLKDKVAMAAAEEACRKTIGTDEEGEAEGIGREKEAACEEEGEYPLESEKEGYATRKNSPKSDDDHGRRMCVDGHVHGKDSREGTEPVCVAKAPNEAALVHGDLINEDNDGTFALPGKTSKEAMVGPCCFTSSKDMLEFFYQLLHGWPLNHDINKYEHMMLEDLLKKGHQESCQKIGSGIKAFQVRINQEFNSRCFYVIRKDGSMKDFSYRKCVDNILSLPKNLKPNISTSNQNQKGLKTQHKYRGPKVQHNSKGSEGRGNKLSGDMGISGCMHGIGNCGRQGRGNHCGIERGNCGGQGRGNRGGQGRGNRGGQGRGN